MKNYKESELKIIEKLDNRGLYLKYDYKELLSGNSKVEVYCSKGHIKEDYIKNLIRLIKCSRCSKLDLYYEISDYLLNLGYTILSKNEEWIDSNSKVSYSCGNGHIQNMNARNMRKGLKCSECYRMKTFYKVRDDLKKENFELLTTEKMYEGCDMKVEFKCPKGHISKCLIGDLNAGNRCMQCCLDKRSEVHRLPLNIVINEFNNNGYQILDKIIEYKKYKLCFYYTMPRRSYLQYSICLF